jgi:hypothetical protein
VDKVFVLGIAVLFLAIVTRADLSNLLQLRFDASIPVINVILYFVLGLLLLAQTQFALLQTRWLWEKIPILPGLNYTWIRYSLIFFLAVGVIVFFLPTEYTVSFLDVVRFLLMVIWQVITGIVFLFMLLFSYILSLLFGKGEETVTESAPAPMALIPQGPPDQPIAWLEYLKSILFWVVLLGIFGYALINYIRQNAALLNTLKRFPLINWIFMGLSGLVSWIARANQKILQSVQKSISSLQAQTKHTLQRMLKRVTAYWMLSPSEQIQFFFLNLVENASQKGYPRNNDETPFRYAHKLEEDMQEVCDDLENLSANFVESRYSNHTITPLQAQNARSQWEKVIDYLRHPPQKKS